MHSCRRELLDQGLVDLSDIFYFSARGGGRGSPGRRARGEGWGGGRLLLKGGGGAEGPGGCLRRIGEFGGGGG